MSKYFFANIEGRLYRGRYEKFCFNSMDLVFWIKPMKPGHQYYHRNGFQYGFDRVTSDGAYQVNIPAHGDFNSLELTVPSGVIIGYDTATHESWTVRAQRPGEITKRFKNARRTILNQYPQAYRMMFMKTRPGAVENFFQHDPCFRRKVMINPDPSLTDHGKKGEMYITSPYSLIRRPKDWSSREWVEYRDCA